MWLNVFNYLIVIVIMIRYNVICKIHRNKLESNNTYTFEKRANQPRTHEYVPLNSITLNLLYNKNKPKHVLNSNKRNHWLKPKKKSGQMNGNNIVSQNEDSDESSPLLEGISQSTLRQPTTTTEVK